MSRYEALVCLVEEVQDDLQEGQLHERVRFKRGAKRQMSREAKRYKGPSTQKQMKGKMSFKNIAKRLNKLKSKSASGRPMPKREQRLMRALQFTATMHDAQMKRGKRKRGRKFSQVLK